ncbi:hypothetical protein CY34DRAFT_805887 [Suillus luteus UH-Slu-Lm8-n1]|uniref:Unplaced genomic scaffold CY34scaffold_133, whole genome shotgun sequence n=1 Tax=Suillus luteus UH-Slu-Lm8-n1 TaxID=930992 RepID=A0A0D0B523_9AGAM|nr:hypothetical protein CY34DRAFT_805887 [Suillus luteus UH-Slu-Lm8-n1]
MRLLTICTTNSINILSTIQKNVQRRPASRARHRKAGRRYAESGDASDHQGPNTNREMRVALRLHRTAKLWKH